MATIVEVLEALLTAEPWTLLIVGGLAFVTIAILGEVPGRFRVGGRTQMIAGVLGVLLITSGGGMYWISMDFETDPSPSGTTEKPTETAFITPQTETESRTATAERTVTDTRTRTETETPDSGIRIHEISIVRVEQVSDPGDPCPARFRVYGQIEVDRGSGTVSYEFATNQNRDSGIRSMTFERPMTMRDDWNFSAQKRSVEQPRVTLEVTNPVEYQVGRNFDVECQESGVIR